MIEKIEDINEELRAYSFNNFYLSGIHAGIQSAHSHDEMTIKYLLKESDNYIISRSFFKKWIKNHKTMVVVNAGMQSDLINLLDFLTEHEGKDNIYPFAYFKEADDALNGTLTNISMVLPKKIFGYKDEILSGLSIVDLALNDSSNSFFPYYDEKRKILFRYHSKTETLILELNNENKLYSYSIFELELVNRISRMRLAN
jgi:hypothetical protein